MTLFQYLVDMDTKWGLMPKRQAVSFLGTHDTQRKLGEPMISFEDACSKFTLFPISWDSYLQQRQEPKAKLKSL